MLSFLLGFFKFFLLMSVMEEKKVDQVVKMCGFFIEFNKCGVAKNGIFGVDGMMNRVCR